MIHCGGNILKYYAYNVLKLKDLIGRNLQEENTGKQSDNSFDSLSEDDLSIIS